MQNLICVTTLAEAREEDQESKRERERVILQLSPITRCFSSENIAC